MLTYRGIPLRRIQFALHASDSLNDLYLVETWTPRKTYTVPLHRIGSDGGIREVLDAVRQSNGNVLPMEVANVDFQG
jgi:hypothetical protein